MKDVIIQSLKEMVEAIESSSKFSVTLYEENGKECGLELEGWTNGGVNMIHFLDFRSDDDNILDVIDICDKIMEIADNFDVDDEIDVHREGDSYRRAFTHKMAVADFEQWEETLQELVARAEDVAKKYEDILFGEDIEGIKVSLKEIVRN